MQTSLQTSLLNFKFSSMTQLQMIDTVCVIHPLSISFRTFSLLIFDQVPLGLRLLKNSCDVSVSILIFLLSIQPKQRARSTASLHIIDGFFDDLV